MYLNVAVNLNAAVLTARISLRYGILTSKKDWQWGSDSPSLVLTVIIPSVVMTLWNGIFYCQKKNVFI